MKKKTYIIVLLVLLLVITSFSLRAKASSEVTAEPSSSTISASNTPSKSPQNKPATSVDPTSGAQSSKSTGGFIAALSIISLVLSIAAIAISAVSSSKIKAAKSDDDLTGKVDDPELKSIREEIETLRKEQNKLRLSLQSVINDNKHKQVREKQPNPSPETEEQEQEQTNMEQDDTNSPTRETEHESGASNLSSEAIIVEIYNKTFVTKRFAKKDDCIKSLQEAGFTLEGLHRRNDSVFLKVAFGKECDYAMIKDGLSTYILCLETEGGIYNSGIRPYLYGESRGNRVQNLPRLAEEGTQYKVVFLGKLSD